MGSMMAAIDTAALVDWIRRFRDVIAEKREWLTELDSAITCLLYTSPSPRDQRGSRMPSSA